jgi:hypothetical protein
MPLGQPEKRKVPLVISNPLTDGVFVALVKDRVAEDIHFQQLELGLLARQLDWFERLVAKGTIRLGDKRRTWSSYQTSIESAAKMAWSKAR